MDWKFTDGTRVRIYEGRVYVDGTGALVTRMRAELAADKVYAYVDPQPAELVHVDRRSPDPVGVDYWVRNTSRLLGVELVSGPTLTTDHAAPGDSDTVY